MGGGASVNTNAEASKFADYRDHFHKVSNAHGQYKEHSSKNDTRIPQGSVDCAAMVLNICAIHLHNWGVVVIDSTVMIVSRIRRAEKLCSECM